MFYGQLHHLNQNLRTQMSMHYLPICQVPLNTVMHRFCKIIIRQTYRSLFLSRAFVNSSKVVTLLISLIRNKWGYKFWTLGSIFSKLCRYVKNNSKVKSETINLKAFIEMSMFSKMFSVKVKYWWLK